MANCVLFYILALFPSRHFLNRSRGTVLVEPVTGITSSDVVNAFRNLLGVRCVLFGVSLVSQAASCDVYMSYLTFGPPDHSHTLIAYLNELVTDSQTDRLEHYTDCVFKRIWDRQSNQLQQSTDCLFERTWDRQSNRLQQYTDCLIKLVWDSQSDYSNILKTLVLALKD